MSSITDMSPEGLARTITEAQHINAAKYYLIASITMMAYDMVLTFHLEYEYIWKRKKTLVSYLFLINRYLNPCYYIITTTAYFDPSWTFTIAVAYPNIDVIFHGCILTGKPSFGNKWQMWLFAYVVFDSSVFALVLAKTLRYSRETHSPLIKTLRNDGTAYFVVIFTVNVVWLVMTFHAAETLKNINEHFSHLVSVVLISRLTIHLRSEGDRHSKETWRPGPPVPSARGRHHSNSFSGPPDQTASVSTYAGQRWARSEKGKNKSLDGVGSPPESLSTTIGPSPGSTVADLNKDVEKAGESSRIWRRSSLRYGPATPSLEDAKLLGEAITFKFSGRTMVSRIYKAATGERMYSWDQCDPSARGTPLDRLVQLYETWGRGGYGMIISGNITVDSKHLEIPGNGVIARSNSTPAHIEQFCRLAGAGKAHGSLVVMQLSHAGRRTPGYINSQPVSAGDVRSNEQTIIPYGQPTPLTKEGIAQVVEQFVYAASIAHQAGFDGIQLHSAYDSLLSQFLSTKTNNRSDDYGGNIDNRSRIIHEIIDSIRKEVKDPGFIIGIKVYLSDFRDKINDARHFCQKLQGLGLDFIELIGGDFDPPESQGHSVTPLKEVWLPV
ncbi:unnamed protein product [Rhizoctonia solani]|uniref:NADH:flavin oxidoreductase/NADH oxidase N-terminal domain-containing protein n=1 Tax=Rhizoctonia solani TaxID=456999 RepID=A0A8H3D7K6_9AGAM|nr:unnamed protein product [Rhizoctonia solani]